MFLGVRPEGLFTHRVHEELKAKFFTVSYNCKISISSEGIHPGSDNCGQFLGIAKDLDSFPGKESFIGTATCYEHCI